MLKNVFPPPPPPSDKMDDPNCGTRRYKYIVLQGWPDMKAKKTLSFLSTLRFFLGFFFFFLYFFFSTIWKARHGLQKSSPVFIFGSAVFWGMLRPSWTPFCGCHYFHTVSVHTHTHKKGALQRELNEIFTAFFLIRTDGHAGVCTVNCCRFIHIKEGFRVEAPG